MLKQEIQHKFMMKIVNNLQKQQQKQMQMETLNLQDSYQEIMQQYIFGEIKNIKYNIIKVQYMMNQETKAMYIGIKTMLIQEKQMHQIIQILEQQLKTK